MANTKPVGVAYSDPDLSGGTIDNTPIGAVTPSTVEGTTVYADVEIGYAAVAQGAVTQLTSKSTAVTLNTSAGQITMNAASLAATTNVTFTLTNSTISAKDVLLLTVTNGTSASYNAFVSSMGAGSATITLRNISASPLAEAVVINFAIIHCA
jgi:uncharacterized protein YbjQ (UPF0145 family)